MGMQVSMIFFFVNESISLDTLNLNSLHSPYGK